jgi:hypothetical protein
MAHMGVDYVQKGAGMRLLQVSLGTSWQYCARTVLEFHVTEENAPDGVLEVEEEILC